MLYLSKKVNGWYSGNQFRVVTVFGKSGIGKSVYALKVLQEVYPDEDIKRFVIFKPEDLINLVEDIMARGGRVKTILMDDAGIWLSAKNWFDPWTQAVGKFMQVARSVTGSIIFTTTSPHNLITDIKNADSYVVRILKQGPKQYRTARGYSSSVHGSQRFLKTVWEDRYTAMLDDKTYNWYRDIRKSYVIEANALMRKALEMKTNGIKRPWRT